MKRSIYRELHSWKNSPNRLPLLVRGARQVGKSYVIEHFGREEFENLVVLNFEINPDKYRLAFESLEPSEILPKIERFLNKRIIPGKTLLFLDEVQFCPRAITSLRYFFEKLPELHVVAAGSLLEFALNESSFSFPVGRVQSLYMHPLTFTEFLTALDQMQLIEFIQNVDSNSHIDEATHVTLLDYIRQYFIVGGMPRVVKIFATDHSYVSARKAQQQIVTTYQDDFGKYATQVECRYLRTVLEKAPDLIGQHVKYSKIDTSVSNPARVFKNAIQLLSHASIIHLVHSTSAALPLKAQVNQKKFKLFFVDIGLMQALLEGEVDVLGAPSLISIRSGQLAEQFVAQQLIGSQDPNNKPSLNFWKREKTGSSAELDFLTAKKDSLIGIEVKAGKWGKLRSLHQFMSEIPSAKGVRISSKPLHIDDQFFTCPFYLTEFLKKIAG